MENNRHVARGRLKTLSPREIDFWPNDTENTSTIEQLLSQVTDRSESSPKRQITIGTAVSGGGSITEAFKAYNQLKHLRSRLVPYNLIAASAANLVCCLGRYRAARAGSAFIFHALHTQWFLPKGEVLQCSRSMICEYLLRIERGKLDDAIRISLYVAANCKTDFRHRSRLVVEAKRLRADYRNYRRIMRESTGVPRNVLCPYMRELRRATAAQELRKYLVNAQFTIPSLQLSSSDSPF